MRKKENSPQRESKLSRYSHTYEDHLHCVEREPRSKISAPYILEARNQWIICHVQQSTRAFLFRIPDPWVYLIPRPIDLWKWKIFKCLMRSTRQLQFLLHGKWSSRLWLPFSFRLLFFVLIWVYIIHGRSVARKNFLSDFSSLSDSLTVTHCLRMSQSIQAFRKSSCVEWKQCVNHSGNGKTGCCRHVSQFTWMSSSTHNSMRAGVNNNNHNKHSMQSTFSRTDWMSFEFRCVLIDEKNNENGKCNFIPFDDCHRIAARSHSQSSKDDEYDDSIECRSVNQTNAPDWSTKE